MKPETQVPGVPEPFQQRAPAATPDPLDTVVVTGAALVVVDRQLELAWQLMLEHTELNNPHLTVQVSEQDLPLHLEEHRELALIAKQQKDPNLSQQNQAY